MIYQDSDTYEKKVSKMAFLATNILASGKDKILKFFFSKESEDSSNSTQPAESNIVSSEDFDQDFDSQKKEPPICNFISTEEKSMIQNNEEVKYFEFKTDPEDTVNLDSLFSILNNSAVRINETAFGNFVTILKSFIDSDEVQTDIMKYIYSRPNIIEYLENHIVHSGGYQALSAILNIPKYRSYSSRQSICQFIVHRQRVFTKLYDKLVNSKSEDEVESLTNLFSHLLKDSSKIWDSSHFIEKIILEPENVNKLFSIILSSKVVESDQNDKITRNLIEFLKIIIEYCDHKFDGEKSEQASPAGEGDEQQKEGTLTERSINFDIPLFTSPVDELNNQFFDNLSSFLPKLAELLPKFRVGVSNLRKESQYQVSVKKFRLADLP
jgi:hypothetical protein